jgi:hypothetical protein
LVPHSSRCLTTLGIWSWAGRLSPCPLRISTGTIFHQLSWHTLIDSVSCVSLPG